MNYLIIAGELSGDNYGGQLAAELKKTDNNAKIWSIGGPALKKESDYFLLDIIGTHSVEIAEQFRDKAPFKVCIHHLKNCCETQKIDRAIIIDTPQKNFKIANVISGFGIPITTFITPNFWVWNDMKSAKKLAAYSQNIITIFKKEYDLYKPLNENTYFFGHPLLSDLKPFLSYRLTRPPKIVILPGSRFNEINRVLPPTLGALTLLYNSGHHFEATIICANPKFEDLIRKLGQHYPAPLAIRQRETLTTPLECSFAITASGSITLELLIQKIPMLILGKISWLSFVIVEHILRIQIPLIGLPNILAEKMKIPELRQYKLTEQNIRDVLIDHLYKDTPDKLLSKYDGILDQLKHESSTFNESAKVIYNDTVS
jgi:lipid-A-disaccharide synthase